MELKKENIALQMEIARLQKEIAEMRRRYAQELSEIEKVAYTDHLTKVWLRRRLDKIRIGPRGSIIMCDIDHFKQINDTHGHGIGDDVLYEFAQRLVENVRHTGGRDADIIRFGGEEFIIFLPNTDSGVAPQIAERLRKKIAGKTFTKKKIPVTASFGITENIRNDIYAMIEEADKALYKSKRDGRNRVTSAKKMTEES